MAHPIAVWVLETAVSNPLRPSSTTPILDDALPITTMSELTPPDTAGANLMGSDLYYNLVQYFVTHLKGLKEVRHPPLCSYPLA